MEGVNESKCPEQCLVLLLHGNVKFTEHLLSQTSGSKWNQVTITEHLPCSRPGDAALNKSLRHRARSGQLRPRLHLCSLVRARRPGQGHRKA